MKTEHLDKEKQEKALKWLKEKWTNACECCGSRNWSLADDLVMFTGKGNIYPHILIICFNCGNAKLFNAVVMGVVVEKQKDKEKEAEKPKDKEKEAEKISDKKIKIFCLLLMLIIIFQFYYTLVK